jgi:hypothetical protein
LVTCGRSASTDFFANSKISGEMIGSAIGFFFIAASHYKTKIGRVFVLSYNLRVSGQQDYHIMLPDYGK